MSFTSLQGRAKQADFRESAIRAYSAAIGTEQNGVTATIIRGDAVATVAGHSDLVGAIVGDHLAAQNLRSSQNVQSKQFLPDDLVVLKGSTQDANIEMNSTAGDARAMGNLYDAVVIPDQENAVVAELIRGGTSIAKAQGGSAGEALSNLQSSLGITQSS